MECELSETLYGKDDDSLLLETNNLTNKEGTGNISKKKLQFPFLFGDRNCTMPFNHHKKRENDQHEDNVNRIQTSNWAQQFIVLRCYDDGKGGESRPNFQLLMLNPNLPYPKFPICWGGGGEVLTQFSTFDAVS